MNLIENQPDIDKIYLYAKDLYEAKYQYLVNKREGVCINHFSNLKALSIRMICMMFTKNIDEYNLDKEIKITIKILIVFDDMIADMIHNKNLNSIVTKLFIRGRKLSISLVFIA